MLACVNSARSWLRRLERHAEDFRRRVGFTYTILDDGGRVVGCVYIYPSRLDGRAAQVRSWVRADRAELDKPLHDGVAAWLSSHWPFSETRYRSKE